jgi:apolipoprotein N-acyltransferase
MKIKHFLKSRNFIAILAGAFCALAFAPFHFFVAAVVSLSVFYFLLENQHAKKQIFWLGFFYGFGFFLAGIYWISISLLVDAQKFAWLIPFCLTLIPSALALYFALFALSYKFLLKKFHFTKTWQKILVFSLCWLFFEFLRSILFTGFPWNLLGHIWLFDVKFAQLASIFGIYGLSFFAVLTCLFPVIFFKPIFQKKFEEISLGDEIFAAILVLFLIFNLVFGHQRINNKKLIKDPQTKLRLVQANIKQDMKWEDSQKMRNFLKAIELTNSKSLDGIKAVIWSETSVPYAIDDSVQLLEKLRQATPLEGFLITGGLRLGFDENHQIKDVWNSVFTLNQNGVVNHYDKHHLVPFGEYVPFQKYLPFVEKITGGTSGFSEGEGAKTVVAQGFSFSPLICYEVIFSNEVIDKKSRPDLFVNVTNDAWFGVSSGPFQHLEMAVMRSIEYGIPLARVANTGISAFIDPFGYIVSKIDLNEEGVIDVTMIKPIAVTIYEKYSHKPLILLILLILIILSFHQLKIKTHASRKNNSR